MEVRTALVIDPGGELGPGLASALADASIRVTATVGYGLEALTTAFTEHPDLTVIRVALPLVRPLQLIAAIHDALPDSPVMAVLDGPVGASWTTLIAAGACVCVEDSTLPGALERGIELAGRYFQRRHRVAYEPQLGGRVIAVFGAKGGVGKTTVATNLAIALQRQSLGSVAIVDADPYCGDVAVALDLEGYRTLAVAAANLSKEAPEAIGRLMSSKFGISVLSGPGSPNEIQSVSAEQMTAVLSQLRDVFDYVVVDTSGAMSELTEAVVANATTRLLVTTPEPISTKDAGRVLRWLREQIGDPSSRILLVENRAGMAGGLDALEFERQVGQAPDWRVADDGKLTRAMQAGIPAVELYPNAPGSADLRRIAASLVDSSEAAPTPSSSSERVRADGKQPGNVAGAALLPT